MTPLVILAFLLPMIIGALVGHLMWPDREVRHLILKGFLGIGLGLGISSLLYFCYLLLFAGHNWFIAVQLAVIASLLTTVIIRERKPGLGFSRPAALPRLTSSQKVLAVLGSIVFLVSFTSTISYLFRRRQGDWDAWMMYNRAARFVFIDQVHWLQSFSPQMDPIFHADYPLLLAMNTTSGWELLGSDSPHIPMVQSALFAIACIGVITTALASVKSPGQAALGLVILWGTPVFVNEGARQMADVPLAFFTLSTGVLVFLFVLHRSPGLMVLAGLAAGLAAWTKNEGGVFVIASLVAVAVAFSRRERWQAVGWYALGLAPPLAVVLGFKFFLAPPSDVLSSGLARSIHQMLDPSRHVEILRFFWGELTTFGSWGIPAFPVGIFVILAIYFALFRSPIQKNLRSGYAAGGIMLLIQALGYYGIYLITPYDLPWHLSYSTTRVVLQVYPLIAFLILSATAPAESVLTPASAASKEVHHVAGD